MNQVGILSMVVLGALFTNAQVPIPKRPLGFVYKNSTTDAPIHIDVFLDLACPDSQRAFPTMTQLADSYSDNRVRIKFFVFPLPYHRNAHIAAIGAQVAYNTPLNMHSKDDSAISWMATVFNSQAAWSDRATRDKNQAEIESLIASYSQSLGYKPSTFLNDIHDSEYDLDARIEFKYGCSRGVAGTPWFFINQVNVAADASWSVKQWQTVVDSLMKGRSLSSTFR